MSGRKNALLPYQIITSGDMSAASITSLVTNIQYMDNIAIQAVWTGSPTGTFSVQVSLNYNPNTGTGDWDTHTTGSATGSAGHVSFDILPTAFPFIRLVYTKTSGTGTLNATIGGKML